MESNHIHYKEGICKGKREGKNIDLDEENKIKPEVTEDLQLGGNFSFDSFGIEIGITKN